MADGRLWVGLTIQKGQYKALRDAGPEALTEELLRRTSPDLAAHLRANPESLKHPILLDVIVGRLETWTAQPKRRRSAANRTEMGLGGKSNVFGLNKCDKDSDKRKDDEDWSADRPQ